MTNLPTPVSTCSQFSDDEPYDGFDLFVAEATAAEMIAAARGISDEELEDNFVQSRIQHAAYDVVDAAIVQIRNHPGYRPTDPDFWERVIKAACKSIGAPALDAPIVEHAIYYARLGWHVFPCGRKKPLTACDKDANGNKIHGTGGFYKATTDEDQIRAWWREFPKALIGIRAGQASGIFAIDIDGPAGLANWNEIVAKNGDAPQTHTHRTPGGGLHLLFMWHEYRWVTNSPGHLKGLKIDVRGHGGYFIAPPSMAKNGKRYEVADPADFFNFAEAPEWLYELLTKQPATSTSSASSTSPTISQRALANVQPLVGGPYLRAATEDSPYIKKALEGEYNALASLPPDSGRNIQLNNSSLKLGHYVGGGVLDEKRVIDTMMAACARNGLLADDGEHQCLASIKSGLKKGKAEPKGIPERAAAIHDDSQATGNVITLDTARTPKVAASIAIPLTYFDDAAKEANKDWIIKGVIAKGETTRVIAPPGKGKSAFAIDLAIHVAAGMDWRGYRLKEKCGVVYFALERADLVKRRLAGHQVRDGLTGLPIAVAGRIINLMDPKCVDIIVATIREAEKTFGCSVGFIVFDVYPKGVAAGGGDENQAKDQGIAITNLRCIQEMLTGIHILNIGHTGKDEGKGTRGSNAQGGDDDATFQISGDGPVKTVDVIKANDLAEGEITRFKLEIADLGTDEDGEPITTAIVSTDDCGAGASKSKSKGELNATERRAMDLLYNALVDAGEDPPPSGEFPHRIKVVRLETWKTYCRRGGLLTSTEEAFQTKFKRTALSLTNKHRIGTLDGLVWIAYD